MVVIMTMVEVDSVIAHSLTQADQTLSPIRIAKLGGGMARLFTNRKMVRCSLWGLRRCVPR